MAPTLHHTISLLLIILSLITISPCKSSSNITSNPDELPRLLYLPVWKDSSTLQYVTGIEQRTPPIAVNLTLDLGGRQLWVDCDEPYISSTYEPARCGSRQCSVVARSKSCFNDCYFPSQPGCYNDTCGLVVDNSVAGVVMGGEVGHDVVYVQSSSGGALREFPATKLFRVPGFLFTCGASFLLDGLADGVSGMAGLGRTEMSFPSQFSAALRGNTNGTFALCLGPTTGAVMFSPFADSDVAKSLVVFTPLLTNPVSTATGYNDGEASSEYFVGVKSIKVNGNPVKVNATLLSIDERGYGGTKISTVDPYTVLESSIYDAVLSAFLEEAADMTRVASVGPFGACFNASGIRMTRVGPAVPRIEVEFGNGDVPWRIVGANSMVRVGAEVVCLGLVDGGADPRTAVVIGGHQLEDNLVVVDVERSRVGLSSSLLGRGRSCAMFVDEFISKESSTRMDSPLR